ncbi:MAG: flavodoxin domain-containing protein [Chloroflexota bacterium]
MRVLVAIASKHGATMAIGNSMAQQLRSAGFDTFVAPVDSVDDVGEFDAVILGSAVYAGHWVGAARDFVEGNSAALASRPVWLFSSGPLGDPPKPVDDPVDAAHTAARIGARGHRVFGGRIDPKALGFGERAVVRVVHAPEGDFRPWDEIRAWTRGIAVSLVASTVP